MRTITAAAVFILALGTFGASASEPEANDARLSEVVRQTEATYQESGLAGLIALSETCFSAPRPTLACVEMDIAASQIDASFATNMGIHRHPYYEPDAFFRRATPVFVNAGMNMQQANAYLLRTTEFVSHELAVRAGTL